jgi:hypothetical protein
MRAVGTEEGLKNMKPRSLQGSVYALCLGLLCTFLGLAPAKAWTHGISGFNLNFINNTYIGATASVARLLTANKINTDGSLSSVAANTARLSADEILNANSGILIEGGITNILPTPNFTGAVTGVIGSGGSFPTGWSLDQGANTMTVTITSTNPLAFTIVGTPTNTTVIYLWTSPSGNSAINITPNTGQSYVLSSWLQQISSTGLTFLNSTVWEFDTTGTFLRTNSFQYNDPPNTDKPWPIQQTYTVGASTVYARPAVWTWVATNGTAVNGSFVIDRPQMEQSAFRSTYQPSATRNADIVTVNAAANFIGSAPWTLDLTFRHPRFNGTYTLAEAKLDANNRIELYSLSNVLKAKVVSASVTLTDTIVGQLPILTTSHAALSVSPTGIAVSLNGKAAKTAALTPPSGLTSLQLGGGTDGYINSTIGVVNLSSTAATSVQVASTSSSSVAFYDDFDRANGAPGTAPTGQTYTQMPTSVGPQVVLATISSKKLVASDSGQATTAAYTTVSMSAAPRMMSGAAIFSAQTTGGSFVFLQSVMNMQTLTNLSAAHDIHADKADNPSYFLNGSFTSVFNYVWAGQPLDGATLGNWATAWSSIDNSVINIIPNGVIIRLVSSQINAQRGPYITYEHFWTGASQTEPSLPVISAEM